MSETAPTTSNTPAQSLPPDIRARFNGELDNASIVAWAAFDLDEKNAYAQRYAVLTERELLILNENVPTQVLTIASITEASIVEGLGVDRMNVISAGKRAAELRYTRRNRREMTRLHRKLERRLPRKD